MNKRIFFGQNDVRYFYYRYKDSAYYSISVLILSLIACFYLFIFLIIPQITKYLSVREEVISQRESIQTINGNIRLIQNLDKNELTSQFRTAAQSLPPEQDIAGILNAVSDAAAKSGVTVEDFKFSLNEEAPGKGQLKPQSVNLQIQLDGNVEKVKKFITEIERKNPVSEVSNVDYTFSSASVNIKFYYKIFPEITVKDDQPLTPLSTAQRQLIDELVNWQPVQVDIDGIDASGSESATPLFQ